MRIYIYIYMRDTERDQGRDLKEGGRSWGVSDGYINVGREGWMSNLKSSVDRQEDLVGLIFN